MRTPERTRRPRQRGWPYRARSVAIAAALLSLGAGPAVAQAAEDCYGDFSADQPEPEPAQINFGIYPGGTAGVIAGPQPEAIPDRRPLIDDALRSLRGRRGFSVHLFQHFTTWKAIPQQVRQARRRARHYHRQGIETEFVVAYRAQDAPDVRGFVRLVRQLVRRVGRLPGVHSIQVTNEVNNTASPEASDGAYEGAERSLIRGVIAADKMARMRDIRHLEVGFNWFYRLDPGTERRFWDNVASGGPRFRRALDWVGLDAYPGTFFPPATTPAGLPGSAGEVMVNALSTLRCFADDAGISDRVPIHVSENGWPTSPTRSPAEQAEKLKEMVRAVVRFAGNYNVTDYRWFALRDSNSSQPDFQQQFGLLRDDYSPKPAFGAYRKLIRQFGR